jgi:hypothetical protein
MDKTIGEILSLPDCGKMVNEYYDYIAKKLGDGEPLNEIEEIVYLLVNTLLISEMEGFVDIFYQAFSLRQCRIVAKSLNELGLYKLAGLFAEALDIYLNGQSDISEEEFRAINPFAMNQEHGQRFDEISAQILAQDSEIYLLENHFVNLFKPIR